jgi:hypothetical protein
MKNNGYKNKNNIKKKNKVPDEIEIIWVNI